jgi:lysophospholipase L1-like esterase
VAGGLILFVETLYAVLRPSPVMKEFDPTAVLGDSSLPGLKVAVLGDSSVTAPGVGRADDIWVRIVCGRLAERYHVDLRSFAVSGSMAHDVSRVQVGPALAFRPHLILVSVGANDAIKGISKKRFERNLDEVISRLSASGAVVVQSGVGDLGTIPRLYPPLREMMTARSAVFDQIHKVVAARNGTQVVEQRSDGRDIWLKDRGLWAADLFHVSARGHSRWAETVWPTIDSAVTAFSGVTHSER